MTKEEYKKSVFGMMGSGFGGNSASPQLDILQELNAMPLQQTKADISDAEKLMSAIEEISAYFQNMANNIKKMDAVKLSRNPAPSACYEKLWEPQDRKAIETAKSIKEQLEGVAENKFDPPGHIIEHSYHAVNSMLTILEGQDRMAEYYGEPVEYSLSDRTKNGNPRYQAIKDVVASARQELDDHLTNLGLDRDLSEMIKDGDWAFVSNMIDKCTKMSERIASCTPEKYAMMPNKGGKPGRLSESEAGVHITELRKKYEAIENPTETQKAMYETVKGLQWSYMLRDQANMWMGQPARIRYQKDTFLQQKRMAQEAKEMMEKGSSTIRNKIHESAEGTIVTELDRAGADMILKEINSQTISNKNGPRPQGLNL